MKRLEMRRLIAQGTARLLALDGSQDYGSAKRKAARQLGAPESQNLPDNQEIEEALREYQALFQPEEVSVRLALLKNVALEYMQHLANFDPHITGSVLNGTAGKHSDINLQLFTDHEKDIEFSLMRLSHPYRSGERRNESGDQAFPRFVVDDPRAAIDITVYPENELRQLKRLHPDGTPRRLRLSAFENLITNNK